MRTVALLPAIIVGAVAWAAEPEPAAPAKTADPNALQWQASHSVYLDGPRALDRLRETNYRHYLRAMKIMEAADELCRPQRARIEYAKFDAQDIECVNMLLLTSNPPKRQIHFRLDDTRYIALVVVDDDPPMLVSAHGQR